MRLFLSCFLLLACADVSPFGAGEAQDLGADPGQRSSQPSPVLVDRTLLFEDFGASLDQEAFEPSLDRGAFEALLDQGSLDQPPLLDRNLLEPEDFELEPVPLCRPAPHCTAPALELGEREEWRNLNFHANLGFANHRGRDLFLNPGDEQWVLAKFAYGVVDKDLKDEWVKIYLLRGCVGDWELLSSVLSTEDDEHPDVGEIEDSGGRIFYRIPEEQGLDLGLHRLRLVVAGDHSFTDLFIQVAEPGLSIIVTDIDGTLTQSADAEFNALLRGELPSLEPRAPELFQLLATKGYRFFYLTARPEWLTARSRSFLEAHGFPSGVLNTSLNALGANGEEAVELKTQALTGLQERGLSLEAGFGDKESDARAYLNVGIPPERRFLINLEGDALGGEVLGSYAELLPRLEDWPCVLEHQPEKEAL